MLQKNLELKVKKAIINIDKNIALITNTLQDLSMKLCYIIKDKRSYYDMLHGNDYFK